MANETTTTTANDIYFAAYVTDQILLEIRPLNVMRPFFRTAPASPSLTYEFPKQDDVAPTAVTDPLAEATDLTTNTALTTSKATVTAAQMGIKATITDLLKKVSLIDALPHFQGVLSRTFAEKTETVFAAALANFSQITDIGATMTIAGLLSSISALEQRDITQNLVGVFHPKQIGQLRSDLTTVTGTFWGAENAPGRDIVKYQNAGPVVTLFGVPLYQTSVVPTADAGANRAGALFIPGEALGLYELWGVRVEMDRDPSLLADEVVLSACFGTVEIDDVRGQTVKTDV